jgi:hypothetical protein
MEYKLILLFACAAIMLMFVTGHPKVAMGLASFTIVAIISFYAMVLFALWNWTRRSNPKQ